ncbi:MAG: major facilitator superfamily domain-containing protein [Benniella sp.]|nr:MAG: major facilitator superfamily domain-containing protein [Benniella sp.]
MPVRSDPHRESFQPPTQTHNDVDSRNSNERDIHQGDPSGSSAPQEPTPLPKLPLFVLSVVIFTEPVTSTILFPFVYFMVSFNSIGLDFHITENEDEIGFYCGLLASSFFFAQFCTSIFWGYMSDRYGRRPIILIGLCGSATTCILFGLSKSLAWAIVSRSMCGLLNGNIGVAKSMLGELSDQTNQSQAFSVFGFAWGMGMVSSYLTDPAKNFPDIFGDWDFFINYPYFLPCLAAGMITIIGFITGYFFLEETKGRAKITRINEDLDHSDQAGTGTLHSNLPDRKVPPLSIKTVVAYAVLALHSTVFEEVYAVFALTPLVSHGLGWTSIQLSTSLAIMGVVQLLGQFVVYPKLGRRFPSVWLFRISQLLYAAIYVSFPIIRAFAVDEEDMETGGQTPRVRYLILTSLIVKYTSGVFAFTSVMVMVSYSCTSDAVEGACSHVSSIPL